MTRSQVAAPTCRVDGFFDIQLRRCKTEQVKYFTYLPTCLDAFSKNFALEATLRRKQERIKKLLVSESAARAAGQFSWTLLSRVDI